MAYGHRFTHRSRLAAQTLFAYARQVRTLPKIVTSTDKKRQRRQKLAALLLRNKRLHLLYSISAYSTLAYQLHLFLFK